MKSSPMLQLGWLCIALLVSAATTGCRSADATIVKPMARGVSQPVPVNKVNDAAIWVHPTDPAKSLLLISNELRGLELHDLDGSLEKLFAPGELRVNSVGLIYGFAGADHARVDLAVVNVITPGAEGVKVLRIDPDKRRVQDVTLASVIRVFDGAATNGSCTYHSRKTGKSYFFVTAKSGAIEQYELLPQPYGEVSAKRVRTLAAPEKIKFCVADDEQGVVYVSEEKSGVRQYAAEPDGPSTGELVIKVGEHGLREDVVGLALYGATAGHGYLIAVSQRPQHERSLLKVYQRQAPHAFVLTIDPSDAPYGPLNRISGVAVTNQPTMPQFPHGVLVANDRINPNASEDFKLFDWDEIAKAGGLLIDTNWSPRPTAIPAKRQ